MDVTFISIHDMSHNARILYASDSIEYILGYLPHEVINKSCWDYFHPEEMPFAQSVHGRGVQLDKAAVLRYCRVKHKLGFWVCCECVFSVVYNVLVACTSIYQQGVSNQKRAIDAPIIRRMFTSSPRDPRYHMLSYLSDKFTQLPTSSTHEPRAALFLNRFSRTLTIMFATDGVAEILGVSPRQLVGKSFYFCIQETSLQDAVRCLESAKANNSIAYLRFWYRNPLEEDVLAAPTTAPDVHGANNEIANDIPNTTNTRTAEMAMPAMEPFEIEAVVSCTSDGLVLVLRRARPSIPQQITRATTTTSPYPNGLFASPWATQPILPQYPVQVPMPTQTVWNQGYPTYNFSTTSGLLHSGQSHAHSPANSFTPQSLLHYPGYAANVSAAGPHPQDLFSTIRDVAVFAWGIVGINGSLEQYKGGQPSGDALPSECIHIWNPNQEGMLDGKKEGDLAQDGTLIKAEAGQTDSVKEQPTF